MNRTNINRLIIVGSCVVSLTACTKRNQQLHERKVGDLGIAAKSERAARPVADDGNANAAENEHDEDSGQLANEMNAADLDADRIRLEVLGSTRVFSGPGRDHTVLGVVTKGTRLIEAALLDPSADCQSGWTEIKPRGWICAKTKETSEDLTTVAMPRLDRRRAVPGTRGTVRSGRISFESVSAILAETGESAGGRRVRMKKTLRVGQTIYWRTTDGDLIAAKDIKRSRGSSFEGVFVDSSSSFQLPVAFVHKKRARAAKVSVYDRPSGRIVGKLDPRQAVNIVNSTHNGRWLKIAADQWIAGKDARLAEKASAPKTVEATDSWVDFNRDTQVIVVYRGSEPIYATLTSSGKSGHRTPVGVYRIEKKVSKTTMNSRPDAEEPYEVKNVPWSMFFHHGYALHGAYWHNKFGTPVSHGCMNLAPTDAKLVYEMLGPEVPAGWSVVTATTEDPGAIVRVKSNRVMEPKLAGSAAAHAEVLSASKVASR